jgi:hypothetical protein
MLYFNLCYILIMLYLNLSCVYGCLLSCVSYCSGLGFIVMCTMGVLLLSYVYYLRIALYVLIAVYVRIAVLL